MADKILVDVHYYIGWFGIMHKVTLLGEEKTWPWWADSYKYKALIKFKSGRVKYVWTEKVIEGKEEEYDI